MSIEELLDRDLTDVERRAIEVVYHRRVMEWIGDSIVRPVIACAGFWIGVYGLTKIAS